jgi:hypothetical protein
VREKAARPHDPDWSFTPVRLKSLFFFFFFFFDVIVPLPGRSPMVEYTYKCNYGNQEILCAYNVRLFMCRTGSWSRRAV